MPPLAPLLLPASAPEPLVLPELPAAMASPALVSKAINKADDFLPMNSSNKNEIDVCVALAAR